MKTRKKLLITLLIIIVLGLGAVYVALMFVGNDNEEGEPFIRQFFPFGGNSDNAPEDFQNTPDTFTEDQNNNIAQDQVFTPSNLTQISTGPATSGFVYTNDLEERTVRYVDRTNGHVFDFNLETGVRTLISNTTVTGIAHALWIDSQRVVTQKNSEGRVQSGIMSIDEETSSSTMFNLEEEIEDIELFGNGFVYIKGTVVTRVTPTGDTSVIATLPLRGWELESSGTTLYVYPKPSQNISSTLYRISTSGALQPVTKGVGLVAQITPENTSIITENTRLRDSTISTIADKCVGGGSAIFICAVPSFFPSGTYPDDWYKGVSTTDDTFHRVDAETGTNQVIQSLPSIDVHNLTGMQEGVVTFVNKKDDTLWALVVPN